MDQLASGGPCGAGKGTQGPGEDLYELWDVYVLQNLRKQDQLYLIAESKVWMLGRDLNWNRQIF